MAVLFKRKHEIKKQMRELDSSNRLVNKMLMIGLVVFLGFSVLSEKRVMEKQKLVWQATVQSPISKNEEKLRVIENEPFSFKISEADIEKLKDLPHDSEGKIELFNVKVNQVIIRQDIPAVRQQNAEPVQEAPAEQQKKFAKPEENNKKQNLPAAQKPEVKEAQPETKEVPAPEAKTNVIP